MNGRLSKIMPTPKELLLWKWLYFHLHDSLLCRQVFDYVVKNWEPKGTNTLINGCTHKKMGRPSKQKAL